MSEILRFPLSSGIREDADPKSLPPGALLGGTNIRQDKAGRSRKRRGVSALSTTLKSLDAGVVSTSTLSGTSKIISRGSDLAAVGNGYVAMRSSANNSWRRADRVTPVTCTWAQTADSANSTIQGDTAVANGRLYQLWTVNANPGAVYVQILDASTGSPLSPPVLVTSSGTSAHVLADGDWAYVWYGDGAGNLRVAELEGKTGAISTDAAYATDYLAGGVFEVCLAEDGSGDFFVAYERSAGANRMRAMRVPAGLGAATWAYDVGGAVTFLAVSIAHAPVAGNVLLAIAESTTSTVSLYGIDETTGAFVYGVVPGLATDADRVVVREAGADGVLLVYSQAFSATHESASATISQLRSSANGAAIANTTRTSYHAKIMSTIWKTSAGRYLAYFRTFVHAYAVGVNDKQVALPSRGYVAELDYAVSSFSLPHDTVAVLGEATGGSVFGGGILFGGPSRPYTTKIAQVSTTEAAFSAPALTDAPLYQEARPTAQTLVRIHTDHPGQWRSAVIGPVAYLGGGVPSVFDGVQVRPLGFLYPPIISFIQAGGVGSQAAGVYYYSAQFEWRDGAGLLHRSAPTAPVSVTAPGGALSSLEIFYTSVDAKVSRLTGVTAASLGYPVQIALHRTKVDGSTYYRLTKEPDMNMLLNEPQAHMKTTPSYFTDPRADANITSSSSAVVPLGTQPQIYTEGGIVESVAPPSFVDVCSHRERVFGIAGDRRTVWASTLYSNDPTVAPWFNESLTLLFAEDKYALGSLDSRMVVFGARGIDVVEGDGPDDTGNARDWRTARLQGDVGCTNPRSVVTMPSGVMFQSSDRGIMLLSRGLEITWIGRDIQDQLASFPVITSACLVPLDHEVRFTCTTEDGTGGIVLAFDYDAKAWFVRTYAAPFVDSAVVDGVWCALAADGVVYQESSSSALDDGAFVESEWIFAPILPGGPNGWGRTKAVQILGTSLSNHDLTISVARDFATTYEQSATFPAEGDATAVGTLELARMDLEFPKGRAFQFKVSDATPTTGALGTGEGLMLEGIALLVTPKPGDLGRTTETRRG